VRRAAILPQMAPRSIGTALPGRIPFRCRDARARTGRIGEARILLEAMLDSRKRPGSLPEGTDAETGKHWPSILKPVRRRG